MTAQSKRDIAGSTWLIVGGAGYIGSHVVELFNQSNIRCVVLDNLSLGKRVRVGQDVPFIKADCALNENLVLELSTFEITGMIHLAGLKQARESIRNPLLYWENNIDSLIGALKLREQLRIPHFLFSSSCSVYGSAGKVDDSSILKPISPYGETKKISEEIIASIAKIQNFNYGFLRYFNVIGSSDFQDAYDFALECLVPNFSRRISRSESLTIYGGKFDTSDGTALRDYVDVRDIANAHLLGAHALVTSSENWIVNVSTGRPATVLEICNILIAASGRKVEIIIGDAVDGDPEKIWAEPSKKLLDWGWNPQFSLVDSIQSHWNNYILSEKLN